ncbi:MULTISPECIES: hypothetical protein [Streptomyces]|uniref:Uncharacterized protein n=1 Tax=Streptomyces chengmaiensis TaxID=3040919 RepID=A0ABT6HPJ4_9ACTN|nr:MULTISPECIES: hypothetical protein [Streptomyces]MDH2390250.1 hypothetical protein [Streptomyces chengmaiensis]WRQ78073.1 hypothetical protein I3F59_001000 [Streptomyces sp. MUM 178J]
MSSEHPPVIVHPPADGGRRVSVHGRFAGLAHGRGDVAELLRGMGFGTEGDTIDLFDSSLVEWRGGGPETWR